MKRRDFLLHSGRVLTGLMIPGILHTDRLRSPDAFSISVVTDQPDQVVDLIMNVIKTTGMNQPVRFEEYQLSGRHMGDLVCVVNRKLCNIHQSNHPLAAKLGGAAQILRLPRPVEHPVCLRFNINPEEERPTHVEVFRNNLLINQLSLDSDIRSYEIEGRAGGVVMAISNRKATVVEAGCRHKTCMQLAPISRAGESLICIPNRISIRLNGQEKAWIDGITF